MNDIREIEYFLEKMKEAAKYGMEIDSKMVYSNLIRTGIKPVRNKYINNNFNDWIQSFKNVRNVNVFVQSNWQYFCQFTNNDYNKIKPEKMIKMYIPIDDAHINEAAKRIFNFMAKNNIIHQSKIGSEVRFDDIVIRVDTPENAKKIEKYIMSDPYIMEGMMSPNPFTFNNGFISYAWDGNLSFNTVISSYISNYINYMADNNKLGNVSYKDFVKYLNQTYQDVFVNNKNVGEYLYSMNEENFENFDNYKKVTELLLQSIMPDKKEKNFFDIYNNIVFDRQTSNKTKPQQYQKQQSNRIEDVQKHQRVWNDIYNFMTQKYGCEEADMRIFLFIENGDYNIFTRDNNIRSYIQNNGLDQELIKQLYLSMNKNNQKREILANAATDTYNKYGYFQIKSALHNARKGKYNNFTNEKGGREMMHQNINPQEIYGLIVSKLLENGVELKNKLYNSDYLYEEYVKIISNTKSNNHRR